VTPSVTGKSPVTLAEMGTDRGPGLNNCFQSMQIEPQEQSRAATAQDGGKQSIVIRYVGLNC
jgi:hypothetical protein